MSQDRRREVLTEIQDDASWDARKYDGTELDGTALGVMHGETLAMIATLAKIVDSILEEAEDAHDND